MHYGNDLQIEKNFAKIVIYKHEILCEDPLNRKYEVELESIQQCSFIRPMSFIKLLMSFEYMFAKEIENMPTETWILVIIKDISGYGDFVLLSSESVEGDFFGLH